MRLRSSLAPFAFWLAATLAGCGTPTSTSAIDATGTAARTERIVINTSDGTQSPCRVASGYQLLVPALTYTVDLAGSTLVFLRVEACPDGTGTRPSTTKTVTLSALDRDAIVSLEDALTVTTDRSCGVDGTDVLVTITHEGSTKARYVDALGTCHKGEEVLAREGVDALIAKLDSLSK